MIPHSEPLTRPALYSICSSNQTHGRTKKIYSLFNKMPPASKPLTREVACLDAIAAISEQNGSATVKDIAHVLGITTTTTTTLLCRLEEKHLIIYQRHKGTLLTAEGKKRVIENLIHRKALYDLLTSAGVPAETAKTDAETLNRELDPSTLKSLSIYIQTIANQN